MSERILVRPSREEDCGAVAAIYGHRVSTGLASFEEVAPERAEMARRRDAVLALGLPYLVAEEAGVLLGFACAGPYRARPAYRFTLEHSVYVAAGSERRGIGGRLLAALIGQVEALGYRQMVAVIGDSANRASIALHERAGFRVVGVLAGVGWKHGRWVDSVLMQRMLGSGDGAPPDR